MANCDNLACASSKTIYVVKRGGEMREAGADEAAIRDYVRQPHVSKLDVTYTDFEGRAYVTTHLLTHESSKHSVVIN